MSFQEILWRLFPLIMSGALIAFKYSYIRNRGKHFIGRLNLQYIGYYQKSYIRETSSQQKREFMLKCNQLNTGILLSLVVGVGLLTYDMLAQG